MSDNCSVSVINGEGVPADRKMAFWLQSKLDIFIGDFVAGESYYVVSKLVADPGYVFPSDSSNPTVRVNGQEISDFQVSNSEEGSFLEFYAVLEAIDPDDYRFFCVAGDGGVWEKGSSAGLSFTFNRRKGGAKKEDSQGIYVDDKEVAKADYLVKDGSVIIELQPAYLETLSAGEHTMTAVFTDEMKTTVRFTVTEKKSEAPTVSYSIPKTGIE